jgi:hypothetical protein
MDWRAKGRDRRASSLRIPNHRVECRGAANPCQGNAGAADSARGMELLAYRLACRCPSSAKALGSKLTPHRREWRKERSGAGWRIGPRVCHSVKERLAAAVGGQDRIVEFRPFRTWLTPALSPLRNQRRESLIAWHAFTGFFVTQPDDHIEARDRLARRKGRNLLPLDRNLGNVDQNIRSFN